VNLLTVIFTCGPLVYKTPHHIIVSDTKCYTSTLKTIKTTFIHLLVTRRENHIADHLVRPRGPVVARRLQFDNQCYRYAVILFYFRKVFWRCIGWKNRGLCSTISTRSNVIVARFKFLQHWIGRLFSLTFQGLVSLNQGGASTRPIQGFYSFCLSNPTYRLLLARNIILTLWAWAASEGRFLSNDSSITTCLGV